MSEVILPCHACGGDDTAAWEYVVCKQCYARGPICKTREAAIAAWNKLPRALRWTNEPPKVAGEYWWRASKGQNVSTLRIWSRSGVFGYWFDSEFITELSRGEWAGPIAPPVE